MAKSVRSSVLFSGVAKRLREAKADAVREIARKQAVLEAVRADAGVAAIIEALRAPMPGLKAALKRSNAARKAGTSVTDPDLYLGRTYEAGAPQWEMIFRVDMLMLPGFKDKYLQRLLDAWLTIGLDAQHATEDEAAWHMRKYHFTWDFPQHNVRVKATLAAHIRNDSPTCRQEVITTEEVVERKQYRLICA